MRFSHLAFLLAFAGIFCPCEALFEDDAGLFDFLVPTTGHGVTRYVHLGDDNRLITSDSPARPLIEDTVEETSCFVGCRNLTDGELIWRRNVCSNLYVGQKRRHVVASLADHVYTMDSTGIVRAWSMKDGALVWDSLTEDTMQPRLWALLIGEQELVVAAGTSDILYVMDATSGQSLAKIRARDITSDGTDAPKTRQWFHLIQESDGNGSIQALLGDVSSNDGQLLTNGASMRLLNLEWTNEQLVAGAWKTLEHSQSFFTISSLSVLSISGERYVLALAPGGQNVVQFSVDSPTIAQEIGLSSWHPLWTSMEELLVTLDPGVIRIKGKDNRFTPPRVSTALFRVDGSNPTLWEQWYGLDEEEETQFDAVTSCVNANWMVALQSDEDPSFRSWHVDMKTVQSPPEEGSQSKSAIHRRLSPLRPETTRGVVVSFGGDSTGGFSVLKCEPNAMTALLSTASGTTMGVQFIRDAEAVQYEIIWKMEDGLSQVTSAVMLDASHITVDDVSQEEDVLNRLLLANRLKSQWDSVASLLSRASTPSSRDHIFAFVKVAVLMSQPVHRLYGMSTYGSDRGSVRWSLQLPRTADWHKMIHGNANSPKNSNGINGGTHSREVLVLSSMPTSEGSGGGLSWICLDGASGEIHAEGFIPMASPVVQVSPLYGGGSCRQAAILLHEDHSISAVPNDDASKLLMKSYTETAPNGFYTHSVDRKNNGIDSFRVFAGGDGSSLHFSAHLVGRSNFPGERIISVTYPLRDEFVQSPCTALGDDSLLLKYLNPHLAVIITALDGEPGEQDEFAIAVEASKKRPTQKRKPAGATPSGDSALNDQAGEAPNLFINLVDTVSGRVLHRATHANAAINSPIPTLITENWIIYAFVNERSRRTEIGVMTLHEGMIDSKGLTAFSSPEQKISFSSLDARESKPIVLSKTYTISKPVVALGVTVSRAGISNPHVLAATGDNKIMTIDRRVFETRRPVGELKDTEKNEGLQQYFELIQLVPLRSLSYNLTVEAPRVIISTPTALESQSLVFAFGGPDIFFTRTSPSRGFDLLPESFNRAMLSVVVAALLLVLVVVKRMASKKIVGEGWK